MGEKLCGDMLFTDAGCSDGVHIFWYLAYPTGADGPRYVPDHDGDGCLYHYLYVVGRDCSGHLDGSFSGYTINFRRASYHWYSDLPDPGRSWYSCRYWFAR